MQTIGNVTMNTKLEAAVCGDANSVDGKAPSTYFVLEDRNAG